jgi:hypothetical protein
VALLDADDSGCVEEVSSKVRIVFTDGSTGSLGRQRQGGEDR